MSLFLVLTAVAAPLPAPPVINLPAPAPAIDPRWGTAVVLTGDLGTHKVPAMVECGR